MRIEYKSLRRAREYLEQTRERYGYRWPDEQIAVSAPHLHRSSLDELDLPDREACFGDPPR